MKYDIYDEIRHEQNWYYLTTDDKILKKKFDVCLPYSPIVSYKKFNDSKYFNEIVLTDIKDEGLVKIIKESQDLYMINNKR